MTWSQEEIDAFKARRAQGEGNQGKVDDFVCADQEKTHSPSRSPRKWGSKNSGERTSYHDDWLGSPTKGRRSWKVKETKKPTVPDL